MIARNPRFPLPGTALRLPLSFGGESVASWVERLHGSPAPSPAVAVTVTLEADEHGLIAKALADACRDGLTMRIRKAS